MQNFVDRDPRIMQENNIRSDIHSNEGVEETPALGNGSGSPSFPSQCPPRFDAKAENLSDYTRNLVSFVEHKTEELRIKLRSAQWITFFQSVSPDASLRKISSKCTIDINKVHLALFQDAEIFTAVKAVHQTAHIEESRLDEESLRLLDRCYVAFEENGLNLEAEQQSYYKSLSAKVIDLRTKFFENLATSPPSIIKDISEIPGLSDSSLSMFKEDGSTLTGRSITLNRPSITRILTDCSNEETRREIFLAEQRIYPENVSLFREIVLLRDETARLLGFRSFADKGMKHKLIGSTESALKLLHDLEQSLQSTTRNNIEVLGKMKGGRIHVWDFDYYHNALLKEKYEVDHQAISEYFPAEYTLKSMIEVFEDLFSLKISKIGSNDDSVWHSDVEPFMVYDATDKGTQIGYLYFDLYPRTGKYNHAANFNIRPSYIDENGQRVIPATALVCNITQAAAGQPTLLRHREVITIFHELGHAIHDLLGKSTYALFHGHRVVKDFVEAPSQLLEYWCWTTETLQKLSYHYSYLSENLKEQYLQSLSDVSIVQPPMHLSEVVVERLVASRGVNQGVLTARQLAFSLFDLRIYHPTSHNELANLNLDRAFNALYEEKTLMEGPGNHDYGHSYATSSHWIWGQEGNYYSYLYTRILAADIWHTNFLSNPMDKDAGMKYRNLILSKGGNQDEMKSLIKLLGREPNLDAFFLHDLRIEKS